tara:strand:+ start:1527 stop:2819 length:1293 start_codon:yes stop_codon:yes gene_type:complete
MNDGQKIYSWIKELYPIRRTLAGPGTDKTLQFLKNKIPNLKINKYMSGTKVFDWTVPNEWHLDFGYIKDPDGNVIVHSDNSSLHIVGYSESVNKKITLNELKKHLYTLEDLPNAIPYVTSFYDKNWGFCIPYNDYKNLKDGQYEVCIESSFVKGTLKTAEYVKKGESKKEIILSTYICHPEMVNNELAAPAILILISNLLSNMDTKYTYRILFNIETIGTLCYVNNNLEKLKKNVIAGFVFTCFGDEAVPNLVPSKYGDTLADSFAKKTLKQFSLGFNLRSYFDKGSEERQYTHPNVNLPFVTITRSLFREYKEYHTSLDNLAMVNPKSLNQSVKIIKKLIENIESEPIYISTTLGEPFLSKKKLYAKISSITKTKDLHGELSTKLVNVISYCDGKNLVDDLYDYLPYSKKEINSLIKILLKNGLIKQID